MKTRDIEVPFAWNCPDCKTPQHDTVNPDLGPFGSVTCGQCARVFEDMAANDIREGLAALSAELPSLNVETDHWKWRRSNNARSLLADEAAGFSLALSEARYLLRVARGEYTPLASDADGNFSL